MSSDLYWTRLLWEERRGGIAQLNGNRCRLTEAPVIEGAPVYGIDYIPEIGMAEIQHRACDPPEDMTHAEKHGAESLLASIPGLR